MIARIFLWVRLSIRKKRSLCLISLLGIKDPSFRKFYFIPTIKKYRRIRITGEKTTELLFLWFCISYAEWPSIEAFDRGIVRLDNRKRQIEAGTLQEFEVIDTN